MSETQLFEHLPSWMLIVIAITAFLNYVLPRFAGASDRFAKLFGPLGRRWRARGLRRAQQHKVEVQTEARLLAREIADEIQPPDYAEMGRRLDNMDKRVRELEQTDQIQRSYIIYDADWHFTDDMTSVGRPDRKPAPRLTFHQYDQLYRNGWRPDQPIPT